ncbi:hypothetical protein PRK78_005000 [Emydomyces testavorans]|uniref:Uncharacterized protein n=1 Tax=Emydomyces testavorans TaxID=2070801 RepID=A0AAF0DL83_9EURO|nr:hypothetical protein PRK78_005000 [Emydomyces testavorans]
MVGDQRQFRPTQSSGIANRFTDQLNVSFLTRCINNGHPYIMFTTQQQMQQNQQIQQMHQETNTVVSDVFYKGQLAIVPHAGNSRMSKAVYEIQRFNHKNFKLCTTALAINIDYSKCEVDSVTNNSLKFCTMLSGFAANFVKLIEMHFQYVHDNR